MRQASISYFFPPTEFKRLPFSLQPFKVFLVAKKKQVGANHIIRRGYSIGKADADDDDDFLFDCFVDNPIIQEFEAFGPTKSLIVGGTGSGKTAVIRKILSSHDHAVRIDPREFSIEYVSNSDVLKVLNSYGVDLDLCFQILWQHLLVLEYIKAQYDVANEDGADQFFDGFWRLFKNDRTKAIALDYLKDWKGQFWQSTDEILREWTRQYEEKISGEGGFDVHALKAKAATEGKEGSALRVQVHERFKTAITPKLRQDLSKVIDLLSEARVNQQKRVYLLIDNLDERWADDSVRFQMIGALVETLRKFRKISNLKILVSLRLDVIERTYLTRDHVGFQRDKLDDLAGRLRWTTNELREIADTRIQLLFKRKYTDAKVSFADIFPKDAWTYIVTRTLMRPRDIVSFINHCLEVADGRTALTMTLIKDAEREYSRLRKRVLVDEWRSTFPTLNVLLDTFANKPRTMALKDIVLWDAWPDVAIRIWNDEALVDPIYLLAEAVANNPKTVTEFAKEAIATLYRVGAIGVKIQAGDRFIYAHSDAPVLTASELSENSTVKVHLMLERALNVRDDGRSPA